jgi:hypothetical protein
MAGGGCSSRRTTICDGGVAVWWAVNKRNSVRERCATADSGTTSDGSRGNIVYDGNMSRQSVSTAWKVNKRLYKKRRSANGRGWQRAQAPIVVDLGGGRNRGVCRKWEAGSWKLPTNRGMETAGWARWALGTGNRGGPGSGSDRAERLGGESSGFKPNAWMARWELGPGAWRRKQGQPIVVRIAPGQTLSLSDHCRDYGPERQNQNIRGRSSLMRVRVVAAVHSPQTTEYETWCNAPKFCRLLEKAWHCRLRSHLLGSTSQVSP